VFDTATSMTLGIAVSVYDDAGTQGRPDGSDNGDEEREHPPILRPWAA
jgi:hypothetical protein